MKNKAINLSTVLLILPLSKQNKVLLDTKESQFQ